MISRRRLHRARINLDFRLKISVIERIQLLQGARGTRCALTRLSDLPELGQHMMGMTDYRKAEEEYRNHAAELSKIAEQTKDPAERERLLRMAEAWLKLAAKMKDLRGEANETS